MAERQPVWQFFTNAHGPTSRYCHFRQPGRILNSMKRLLLLAGFKVCIALLGFAALVTELAVLADRGTLTLSNFFSYFTVESNLVAVVVLLVSAFATALQRRMHWLALVRGAAVFYMATTGIVFALLLSGLDDVDFTAVPWTNVVLHHGMPVALLVDWLVDKPGVRIAFREAMWWLVAPLVYVLYSLVRGPLAGWYPYPFLSPDLHSYDEIALTCAGIACGLVGIIWALLWFVQLPEPKKLRLEA